MTSAAQPRTRAAAAFMAALFLLLLSGCETTKNGAIGNEVNRTHYVPMREGYKTVYGYLFYHGSDENRKKDGPFSPWNVKGIEICFETVSSVSNAEPREACQRLERYNREGNPPDWNAQESAEKLYKESFFAVFVDGNVKELRLKSITLHSKKNSYRIGFLPAPAGKMPDKEFSNFTDFINFGFFSVKVEEAEGQKPEASFAGVIQYPFTTGIKVEKGNCAAVVYKIPYVMEQAVTSQPSPLSPDKQ